MQNLESKKISHICIIWLIVMVVLAGSYFLILIPQKAKIEKLSKEIDQKTSLYTFAKKLSTPSEKEKIQSQRDNIREVLSSFLVGYKNADNLAFDISNIATNANLKDFAILKSSSEKDSKDFTKISIGRMNLQFYADFNQFAEFINFLERNKPVVFVDKFSIELLELNSYDNPVTMSVECFIKEEREKPSPKS